MFSYIFIFLLHIYFSIYNKSVFAEWKNQQKKLWVSFPMVFDIMEHFISISLIDFDIEFCSPKKLGTNSEIILTVTYNLRTYTVRMSRDLGTGRNSRKSSSHPLKMVNGQKKIDSLCLSFGNRHQCQNVIAKSFVESVMCFLFQEFERS